MCLNYLGCDMHTLAATFIHMPMPETVVERFRRANEINIKFVEHFGAGVTFRAGLLNPTPAANENQGQLLKLLQNIQGIE